MCVFYHKVDIVSYNETYIQVLESWYRICKLAYIILYRLMSHHQIMMVLFSGAVGILNPGQNLHSFAYRYNSWINDKPSGTHYIWWHLHCQNVFFTCWIFCFTCYTYVTGEFMFILWYCVLFVCRLYILHSSCTWLKSFSCRLVSTQ